MYATFKNTGSYCRIDRLPDGRMVRMSPFRDLDTALAIVKPMFVYASEQELKENGYTLHRSIDAVTPGEVLVGTTGRCARVLARSGYGDLAVIDFSYWNEDRESEDLKVANARSTIHEIKKKGWKLADSPDDEVEKAKRLLTDRGVLVDGKVIR